EPAPERPLRTEKPQPEIVPSETAEAIEEADEQAAEVEEAVQLEEGVTVELVPEAERVAPEAPKAEAPEVEAEPVAEVEVAPEAEEIAEEPVGAEVVAEEPAPEPERLDVSVYDDATLADAVRQALRDDRRFAGFADQWMAED